MAAAGTLFDINHLLEVQGISKFGNKAFGGIFTKPQMSFNNLSRNELEHRRAYKSREVLKEVRPMERRIENEASMRNLPFPGFRTHPEPNLVCFEAPPNNNMQPPYEYPNSPPNTTFMPLSSPGNTIDFSSSPGESLATDFDLCAMYRKRRRSADEWIRSAKRTQIAKPDVALRTETPTTSKRKRSSKYRGVSQHKRDKKWIARAWVDDRMKHLGCFVEEDMAALIVDMEKLKTHGENARLLNFKTHEERMEMAKSLITRCSNMRNFPKAILQFVEYDGIPSPIPRPVDLNSLVLPTTYAPQYQNSSPLLNLSSFLMQNM